MRINILMKDKKISKTTSKYLNSALILMIPIILAVVVSKFFFQLMLIQGDSMLPSYHNMQLVVLNKYDRDYEVGDVIAIKSKGLDAIIVKRIDTIYPEGYYVLGDNREHSVDSRDQRVGLIEQSAIIGKVIE